MHVVTDLVRNWTKAAKPAETDARDEREERQKERDKQEYHHWICFACNTQTHDNITIVVR